MSGQELGGALISSSLQPSVAGLVINQRIEATLNAIFSKIQFVLLTFVGHMFLLSIFVFLFAKIINLSHQMELFLNPLDLK